MSTSCPGFLFRKCERKSNPEATAFVVCAHWLEIETTTWKMSSLHNVQCNVLFHTKHWVSQDNIISSSYFWEDLFYSTVELYENVHLYSMENMLFRNSGILVMNNLRPGIPAVLFLRRNPLLGDEFCWLARSEWYQQKLQFLAVCEMVRSLGMQGHWYEAIMRFSWMNNAAPTCELHKNQLLRVLPSSSSANEALFLVRIMKENWQHLQLFCQVPAALNLPS